MASAVVGLEGGSVNWRKKIKIKHFCNGCEDHKGVQKVMSNIADVLTEHSEFSSIVPMLRHIPKGDEFFSPADYANKILDRIYDIADCEGVWIE